MGNHPRVQFQRLQRVQKLPQLLFARHHHQELTFLLRLTGELIVEHHFGKVEGKLTLDFEGEGGLDLLRFFERHGDQVSHQ